MRSKKQYYGRRDVARGYDAWRFGSAGGRYVDSRELRTMLRLVDDVPRNAPLLDLPVGTGRAAAALVQAGFRRVEGADSSRAMLDVARERCGDSVKLSQQDAFATSYSDGTFECIVSLRFLFHHPDVAPLLREFARLLRPEGTLVVDVLRWSPRSMAPRVQDALGGRVWTLGDRDARAVFRAAGFEIVDAESILIAPSLVYRFTPSFALGVLDGLERSMPDTLRSKTFWRLRRSRP